MKVGDIVKLKPEMWQKWKLKPESYGLSFEGKYVVEEVIEYATYAKIRLVGLDEEWEQDYFQPYKTTFKVKVLDKEVYEVEELEDGSWKFYFYNNTTPFTSFTYPKSSVDNFLNDGNWKVLEELEEQLKKFKFGDKVVCVKNTPSIQEGWVGYVDKVVYNYVDKGGYIITARQEYSTITYEFLTDELEVISREETLKSSKDSQYTGGSSDYYKVFVKHPTTLAEPYEAECNDIIEALDMTFAEGNAFKAIWRKAKARQGVQKKGYDNGLYDSEKVVFFGERMVVEAKEKASESNEETKLD